MKKWKLGNNPEMDKKLKVGMVIWFKSEWIIQRTVWRISIGKIIQQEGVNKYKMMILKDIKKDIAMNGVGEEWCIHKEDEVELLSWKEQFAYMI